jgi:TRAP-type uncharacterized transport system substrate-binding protein
VAKIDYNQVLRIALFALSLGVIAILAVALFQGSKTERLTLAAGASTGESYILGHALKTVLKRFECFP